MLSFLSFLLTLSILKEKFSQKLKGQKSWQQAKILERFIKETGITKTSLL